MTRYMREHLRTEIDHRARAAQPAYDELELLLAENDTRVFDKVARDLTTDALLGLSIGAEHALERSAA